MFDRLIDLFVTFLEIFRFWVILDEYERAVCLTFGKRRNNWVTRLLRKGPVLGPGFHVIMPFHFERILPDNVVPAGLDLGQQSLTTQDGVEIVLSGVILWSINDIEKTALAVEEADEVLELLSCGIIGGHVADSTWHHVHANGFAEEIAGMITETAQPWGITVHKFQFKDLSKAPSLRLWNEGTFVNNE